jgi:tRNA-dihydrouridine synthase
MDFEAIAKRLKGHLFLSSMMGRCNGSFCAARSRNCAMVQLGAFALVPERDERNMYWPEPDREKLTVHLKEQFDTFRAEAAKLVGDENVPVVSANIFPCTDRDIILSAETFIEAGGELYELNSHGGIGGDRERGTGAMLFIPEHTPKLIRWAKMLVDAGGPVIIKADSSVIPDFTDHVRQLEDVGVHAFHINVRDEKTKEQNLAVLEQIRAATGMFLLASGYVKDSASARTLFDAGADCVGIAQAAISDVGIFTKSGG